MHVGKQFAGAAKPCLDLIHHEQYAILTANFSSPLQESRRRNDDSRLALNRLDQKRARVRSNRIAKSVRVSEGNDLESRRERPEAVAILLVSREADDRRGAAVKIVGAHDDLGLAVGNALDLVAPLARGFDR